MNYKTEYTKWYMELQKKIKYVVYNEIAPVMPWLTREEALAEVKLWAPEDIEKYYDLTKYINDNYEEEAV